MRIGIPVCEDIWGPEVVECLSETGGEILLVPNGSPYWRSKTEHRLNIAVARVVESGLPLIYLNMVGGQDELVFDGASFALNADRSVGLQLPAFEETVALTEWRREGGTWHCSGMHGGAAVDEGDKADYTACMLGLRDYVDKNGFKGVVLGLSGGIDSALCTALAVDALGAGARALRDAAVSLHLAGVARRRRAHRQGPRRALRHPADRAGRARARRRAGAGVRRPEARRHRGESAGARPRHDPDGDLQQVRADGGDDRQQVGDVGRLRDALRRHERRLQSDQGPLQDRGVPPLASCATPGSRQARAGPDGEVIRKNVIVKPPTAELRENQKDQDTLPPYDMLDQILERLVEHEEPIASIVAAGFERDTVVRVERMLNLAEYKRRQAAPGVKVTLKNFGRDRRYPIVNRFRDTGAPLPEPDQSLVKGGGAARSEAFDF